MNTESERGDGRQINIYMKSALIHDMRETLSVYDNMIGGKLEETTYFSDRRRDTLKLMSLKLDVMPPRPRLHNSTYGLVWLGKVRVRSVVCRHLTSISSDE